MADDKYLSALGEGALDEIRAYGDELRSLATQIADTNGKMRDMWSGDKNFSALQRNATEAARMYRMLEDAAEAYGNTIAELEQAERKLFGERRKQTSEGKTQQDKRIADIKAETESLKASGEGYRLQKTAVESYTSALQVLKEALAEAKEKSDELKETGQESVQTIQTLNNELTLLTILLHTQGEEMLTLAEDAHLLQAALDALKEAGLQSSDSYASLLQKQNELKDSLAGVTGSAQGSKSILEGMKGSAEALAATYNILVAGADLFGIENKELEATMQKLQAVVTILNSVQQLQNLLQKEGAVATLANTLAAKGAAAAQWFWNTAIGAGTTAVKLFKTALVTTGVGALVVLLGEAAGALMNMTSKTEKASDKQKDYNAELERSNKLLDRLNTIEKERNARKGGIDDLKRELELAKAKGATANQIYYIEQTIRQKELANLKVRQEVLKGDAKQRVDLEKEVADKANEIAVATVQYQKAKSEQRVKDVKTTSKNYVAVYKDEAAEIKRINEDLQTTIAGVKKSFTAVTEQEMSDAVNEIEAQTKRLEESDRKKKLAEGPFERGSTGVVDSGPDRSQDLSLINYPKNKEDAKKKAQTEKQQQKEKLDHLKEQIKLTKKYAEVLTEIAELAKAESERKLEQIAVEREEVDARYEQEMAYINNAAITEEEREQRKRQLIADTESKRMELKLREREERRKQAQYEKGLAVMQIILNTASAIVEALPNPALSVAAGIIGAAQLVKALATPIPEYADGTNYHPGGLALVGEGGQPEYVKEPGQKGYWVSGPTLDVFAAGTSVIPMSDMVMAASGYVVNSTGEVRFDKTSALSALMVDELKGLRKDVRNMPQSKTVQNNGLITFEQRTGNRYISYLRKRYYGA